jgi:methyltransferase-like protein
MSYEDLPYPSLPLAQTHPERAATAATLHGMAPASVQSCRILELGCASGGNLIPMAVALPGSEFLGIDLSARQIAAGQSVIATLGLGNVALRQADLVALAADASSLGEYDYIVCHGVYSWVPEPVRRAILAICQRHLSRAGIAYISYNTLPGFYRRQPIRDMMRFHVEQLGRSAQLAGGGGADGARPTATEAVRESRALLDLLRKACSDRGWAQSLGEEAELLRSVPDGYLFHEHLEPENHPFYFHEFVAAAQEYGLKYLTEAVQLGTLDTLPPEAQQRLHPFRQDLVVLEQYLDFIRNQSLRCTLLCRSEVALTREPVPRRLLQLSASCMGWPSADRRPTSAELRSSAGVAFSAGSQRLTVHDPPSKAVLLALCNQDPQALSFTALGAHAAELLGKKIADELLAEILMNGYRAGLVRLHVTPPRFALTVSERPLASPLARLQAQMQAQVANLRHQVTELSPLEQHVLTLLDGEHARSDLLPTLVEKARSGALALEPGRRSDKHPEGLHQTLSKQLEPTLRTLARCALLLS